MSWRSISLTTHGVVSVALSFCLGFSQGLALKRKSLMEAVDIPLSPILYGIKQWRVGESSRYQVTLFHPGFQEVFHLTLSIVGKEDRNEQSLFWLETIVEPQNSSRERVINKVLRPYGDLSLFALGAVGEILSQVGDNQPIAVPAQALNPYLQSASQFRKPKDWTLVGLRQEKIKVAAGNFATRKGHFNDSEKNSVDVWFNPSIGPLGIVRATRPNLNLELLGYTSKGSLSSIYGSPIILKPQ